MENNTPEAAPTEDVDALLESVYKPEAPTPQTEAPQKPAPEAPAVKKFTLKRGNDVFEKDETEVLSLAQKGLDYDLNNRLLRQERELLDLKKKELGEVDPERIKIWKQYDEFAASKPEFAEAVLKEYQRLQMGLNPEQAANPLLDKVMKLESELNQFKSVAEKQKLQKEDQELDHAIKETRSKVLPEINWEAADENGLTNEHKVLRHMTDNGFPTFKAAALDLFAEEAMNQRAQKAAEKAIEDLQSKYKKGLVLNKRITEPGFVKTTKSIRDTTYDELLQQSMNELGIGG